MADVGDEIDSHGQHDGAEDVGQQCVPKGDPAHPGTGRLNFRRRRPLIASALAKTEVARALLSLGPEAVRRGHDVLARIDLVRINDRVLDAAGAMLPVELRSVDAIHLATAQQLGADPARIVTYDDRMAAAADQLGLTVARPT